MKILILILLILLIRWLIKTVNGFQKKEIRVQESLSGIEVALTKRYDLLTKMISTAKGYMEHERELFTRTIELRRGMSVGELAEADQKMDMLSGRFFAVAEGYPELRSSEVFVELQKGIRDAEEHLQAARRLYNASVADYNTAISVFPAKLLGWCPQAQGILCGRGGKTGGCKDHILTVLKIRCSARVENGRCVCPHNL